MGCINGALLLERQIGFYVIYAFIPTDRVQRTVDNGSGQQNSLRQLDITTRPVNYYYRTGTNSWPTRRNTLNLWAVRWFLFACCVLMSWAGFWIKLTNAPARVALTLTTYLSVQTLRQAFILSIPKVPYLKLFDVWSIACESMIFASLMEFTLAQVKIYNFSYTWIA